MFHLEVKKAGKLIAIVAIVLIGSAGGGYIASSTSADASRNSAGTYSIPNTFVTGTAISSTAMNANYSDISTEMTDSLSRSGKGGMLAALRGIDGTVSAPALSFTSETGTGWYRAGANNPALSVAGTKRLECTTTGCIVTGTLNLVLSGSASGTVATWLQASLADGNSNQFFMGKDLTGGGSGILTYTKNATAANSTWCMGVFSGSASTLCVDGNNKVTIGSSGTPIGGSFRGTTTWDPPSLAVGNFASTTITVTGAAAGADCNVTPPSVISTPYAIVPVCWVTLNTCNIQIFSAVGTNDVPSGTWACRVWNP